MNAKVVRINEEELVFDNGFTLSSHHVVDCCEYHWMETENLNISDFEGLEFNLKSDKSFERVDGYGIRLIPLNGHPISIPCYGSNNGYYSTELELIVSGDGYYKSYDISECQEIN